MDNRSFQSGASASPPSAPASPSAGYPTSGNPSTGTPATLPGEYWFHQIGEELRAVIVDSGQVPSNSDLTQLSKAVKLFGPPPGAVIHVAMNSAPFGYLKADGAAVSRATYAALFSAIGTVFGVGDGSTTFNLPDLRGEFLRGWDDARGVDIGRTFGSSQAESKVHDSLGQLATPTRIAQSVLNPDSDTTDTPTSYQISNQGTGSYTRHAYGVRPRNVALLACIKY